MSLHDHRLPTLDEVEKKNAEYAHQQMKTTGILQGSVTADLPIGRAVPRVQEADCTDASHRSLANRLRSSVQMASDRITRQHRALQILSRHPEFEEFLELQQLLNSGI